MKHQMVFLLAGGRIIRSMPTELDEKQRAEFIKLMEHAAAGQLNYMNFERDTGSHIILSQDALRTMAYCELVEFVEPQTNAWKE